METFWVIWGVFTAIYVVLSVVTRGKHRSYRNGSAVGLGLLALSSSRIDKIPGLIRVIPSHSGLCRALGGVLLFLGAAPIWGPFLLFWMPQEALSAIGDIVKPWFEPDSSNLPIAMIFLALFLLSWLFRIGKTVIQLPETCRRAGWEFSLWLAYTRSAPGRMSLFVRDLPIKNAWKPFTLNALSLALLPIGFICFLLMMMGGAIGAALGFLLGTGFHVLARRLRQTATALALKDALPDQVKTPTVYLRAFKDDPTLANMSRMGTSLEESIILALMAEGRPVVALGKPGEKLPPVGAQRFYVDDSEWQNVVHRWVTSSHAVVMVAATTEATAWELKTIFAAGLQSRFLLLFIHQPAAAALVEKTTFDRLAEVGVDTIGLRKNLAPGDLLLGVAFQPEGEPVALAASKRDDSGLAEVLKWHRAKLNAGQPARVADVAIYAGRKRAVLLTVSSLFLLILGLGGFYALRASMSQAANWQIAHASLESKLICGDRVQIQMDPKWRITSLDEYTSQVTVEYQEIPILQVNLALLPAEVLPKGDTIEDVVQLTMQAASELQPKLVSRRHEAGSQDWEVFIYTFERNGTECQAGLYIASRDDYVVRVIAECPRDQFERWEKLILKQMLNSFQIVPKQ